MQNDDARADPAPFIDKAQIAALAAAPKSAPAPASPQPSFRWGTSG
jgi:hypothetical protein